MSSGTDSTECVQRLQVALGRFVQLIDGLIAVTCGHESATQIREETTSVPEQVGAALTMLLQAAGSSSHTIRRLSDAPGLQIRDCYSIARSVVEIVVNACYIMAEGPSAAERAFRHARQKSFQDLKRESQIGESGFRLFYEGRPDPASVEGMEADIAAFTSREGREKGWVDGSIDHRIETIGKRFGKSLLERLHMARFAIYRHSSEVLHGTLFGAMCFFGLTAPSGQKRTPEQARENIGHQHMMILLTTILALLAAIEAFHDAFGFRHAHEQAEELFKGLQNLPLMRREVDVAPTTDEWQRR